MTRHKPAADFVKAWREGQANLVHTMYFNSIIKKLMGAVKSETPAVVWLGNHDVHKMVYVIDFVRLYFYNENGKVTVDWIGCMPLICEDESEIRDAICQFLADPGKTS